MKRLLIKNASWVIVDSKSFFENGSIFIEGNEIKDIGCAKDINNRYEKDCDIVKDCKGCIVTPGLINSHNHIYEILQRGLGKNLTMEDWLYNIIYPATKEMSSEDYYYAALLACMDIARNGTTAVVDQMTNFSRFQADQDMAALIKFGMRGAVARASSTNSIIDEGENRTTREELEMCTEYLDKWSDSSLVEPWLGPTGLYACDPETLKQLKKLSLSYGRRFHIHLSETQYQLKIAREAGYEGQIVWANEIGLLDNLTSVAHCVWINEREIDILNKSEAQVVHNPSSNQILSSGIANIPLMRKKGVNVAIGSDGPASNDSQDMVTEMKYSVLLHRVNTLDPQILNAEDGFEMATIGGSKVLGNDRIGTLKVGNLADIACFKVEDNPSLFPVFNPIDALVFYGSGRDNVLTIINGQIVYDHGKFPTINKEEVYEAVEESRKKMCRILEME